MSKPFKMKAAGHNNSPMQKNFPEDIGTKPGETPNKNALQGAAQGAKLGATLGSVVPGLGNVAGALIGGAGGAIFGGIKANKAKKAEAAAMAEEEKNAIVAAKLEKDAEREAMGYGETDNETGPFSPTTT